MVGASWSRKMAWLTRIGSGSSACHFSNNTLAPKKSQHHLEHTLAELVRDYLPEFEFDVPRFFRVGIPSGRVASAIISPDNI